MLYHPARWKRITVDQSKVLKKLTVPVFGGPPGIREDCLHKARSTERLKTWHTKEKNLHILWAGVFMTHGRITAERKHGSLISASGPERRRAVRGTSPHKNMPCAAGMQGACSGQGSRYGREFASVEFHPPCPGTMTEGNEMKGAGSTVPNFFS